MTRFQQLANGRWQEVFHESGRGDWKAKWTLDGLKAKITNGPKGMDYWAGPEPAENASHAVLWTKQDFRGDLKIEFEYTRLDAATGFVNIIYIEATGSGVGPHAKDIAEWAYLRTVPAMKTYYNHMNTYSISYAAYDDPKDPENDHIRLRRYLPDAGNGLKGTEIAPDYRRNGLFKPGVPHKFTIIKKGQSVFLHIKNAEKDLLCQWKNDSLSPILEGRIGLRHMCTRGARYRDFRVSLLKEGTSKGDD